MYVGCKTFIEFFCPLLQGAAAYWLNLKKSGEGDLRTRHAGCPVLVGSKWGMSLLYDVMTLLCDCVCGCYGCYSVQQVDP